MTVDDQLREIARQADRYQRAITADEIVRRASGHDVSDNRAASAGQRRGGRPWVLVAAAAIVLVVVGLLVMDAGEGPDRARIDTISPTPGPFDIAPGSIAFAADAGAGDALTDPLPYATVETRPQPMDIYVTRDGEPTRQLLASDAHERCPTFSPDGERLAYLEVVASGGSQLPTIVVRRLNEAEGPNAPEMRVILPASETYGVKLNIGVPCPQWSPDGSRLAYLAYQRRPEAYGGGIAELRVSTLDGQERVINAGRAVSGAGSFAWSPDGDAIAYAAADGGVWTAPLDGGGPSLVWRPDGTPNADSRPTSLSWSSRGELAVTVLTQVYDEGSIRDDRSVHVVDVDTGRDEQMRDVIHVYDYEAAWSPDGSRLAFVGDDGHIRVSDRDDVSTARLSPRQENGRDYLFWDVAWSPAGDRLLALARSDRRGFALISLSSDGASAEVLTPWTWALDWINLADVSWQPIAN